MPYCQARSSYNDLDRSSHRGAVPQLNLSSYANSKIIESFHCHRAASNETNNRSLSWPQKAELDNLVHRGYSTGFLLGREPEHNFENKNNIAKYQFVGEVEGNDGKFNILRVHNQVSIGDKLEAITPEKNIPIEIKSILGYYQKEVKVANGGHKNRYYFEFDKALEKMSLVRKMIK